MTRDDIIRMAREAGLSVMNSLETVAGDKAGLERFAALVSAAEREARAEKLPAQEFEIYRMGYKQGASDERLMFAALCDDLELLAGFEKCRVRFIFDAIRARGKQ